MEEREGREICKSVPDLLSAFVDVFVDFSVSGFFLPQNANPISAGNPENCGPGAPLSTSSFHTRYTAPERLVAIGDLHGDLEKSKEAFRLAGLIDASDRWIGDSATVVQIGDILDRGGCELKILYLIEKLKHEATKCGGKILTMNGNHEIMNVEGDFRYVTPDGLEEFKIWAHWYCLGNKMKGLCSGLERPKDLYDGIPFVFPGVREDCFDGIRARIAALRPGGPIARRFLSKNSTVLVIGDSVFAHGGLLTQHVEYGFERINDEVRKWIRGLRGRVAPKYCRGKNSVVWLRRFSDELTCDCSSLEHLLATIPGARRIIMGHTIQEGGINGACDNKAIRIDVGMSKGCIDGLPEVLEIRESSGLRILTSHPSYNTKYKSYSSDDMRSGLVLLFPKHGTKPVEVRA